MEQIPFDTFAKLDLRIGTIEKAEPVEDADLLLKLTVSLGDETRVVVAGIAKTHTPDKLIGLQVPVVANLEPKTIRGVESQGMILAANAKEGIALLHPEYPVPPGATIQ